MTRDEILHFLTTHKQLFKQTYGVEQIGLFGSFARQSAHEGSDVDLLVEFETGKKTLRNFFGFKRYLEKNLGAKVDLGMESALKPVVRESIKNDILYV